jgi:transcriptional regulator with XRE-family HTH domain
MATWQSRISDLRKKPRPGLTLKAIAELIGMSESGVCDIEQGRSKSPRGDAAILLIQLHEARCSRSKPSRNNLQHRT